MPSPPAWRRLLVTSSISGKRQVGGAAFESGGDGMLGGEATHGSQVSALNSTTTAPTGGLERAHRGVRRPGRSRTAAGLALAGPIDEGMGDVGIVDHDPFERRAVVGTEQPAANRINEGLVEQQLALSALDQLLRTAIGPDRFADAS